MARSVCEIKYIHLTEFHRQGIFCVCVCGGGGIYIQPHPSMRTRMGGETFAGDGEIPGHP